MFASKSLKLIRPERAVAVSAGRPEPGRMETRAAATDPETLVGVRESHAGAALTRMEPRRSWCI